MSETTFCDALDPCEVHGHDIKFIDMVSVDMIGTLAIAEECERCGKTRETVTRRAFSNGRLSETRYPDGVWR